MSGSEICAWCGKPAPVGEFILVVHERGRAHEFIMHPKCLPPEVKAARKTALSLV